MIEDRSVPILDIDNAINRCDVSDDVTFDDYYRATASARERATQHGVG